MIRRKRSDDTSNMRKAALAALKQAEDMGWSHVSGQVIAADAGLALSDLYALGGKFGLLDEIDRYLDEAMGEGFAPLGEEASPEEHRQRLSEVMMQRFDRMEAHRNAITSIHEHVMAHPGEIVKASVRRHRTARWALFVAQVGDGPVPGVRSLALAAAFMRAKQTWLDDEAPCDMTMAAIDRDLRTYADWTKDAANVTGWMSDFFRSKRRKKSPEKDDSEVKDAAPPTTSDDQGGDLAPPPPPL